ncbi:Epoxide hydrolase ascI [Psilocybe cubensis]|uniref:Epoxide hydrolase ascI n=2 Tax=Psilocybe cubensis TaxID=181762 RepID=A0ACB8H8Y5_PSICU|nr:Epoxide hydrolase ascI [Psilocybe cubensis]KAH9484185.1 Epoxide hydrolase ascI [Psilocybe cubensis]
MSQKTRPRGNLNPSFSLQTVLTDSITGLLLALVVFPSLTALAVSTMFGRFKAAGMDLQLRRHCLPSSDVHTDFRLDYTGIGAIDKTLCPLVTFFHNIMDNPTSSSFLSYAIGISGPMITLPLLEAYRLGQSRFVLYPVVWGLLSQIATVGMVFPLYWLAFILTEGAKVQRTYKVHSFTQAEAEAIIFGIVVGAVIPSLAMLFMADAHVTAIWQLYPLYISIAQLVHMFIRPPSKHSQSGIVTIRALYLGLFIVSSSMHISTVWPLINDFSAIKELLLPSSSAIHPSKDINNHLLEFLKWDVIIAYSATALAMLWFSKNVKQLITILLWYAVAIPVFGFGAAVMGVAIWRDGILN